MDIKPENVLFSRTECVDEAEIKLRQEHYAQKADRKALRDAKKKLEKEGPKLGKNQKKRLKEKIKRFNAKVEAHPDLEELPNEAQASVDFVDKFLTDLEEGNPLPNCVLCDLGTACWTDKVNTCEVGTRYGFSPEMLLGLRYDPPADIWAAACLAVEFATGDPLFDPDDEDEDGNPLNVDGEHLRLIAEALGPRFPKYLYSATNAPEFLTKKGEVRHAEVNYVGLQGVIEDRCKWPEDDVKAFVEFLEPMLRLRPMDRATAAELKCSPWLEVTAQDIEESKEQLEETLDMLERETSDSEEENEDLSDADENREVSVELKDKDAQD